MKKRDIEGIIKKLLGIEYEIDPNTSLIKYGGDSLFFGRLQIELKRRFGLKVPIRQLFQNGTIAQLCKVLEVEDWREDKIEATDLQIAYLHGRKSEMILGGKGSRAYFSFEAEDLDINRLQQAIKELIQDQDILRCTFHEDKYFRISEKVNLDFLLYDYQGLSNEEIEEKLKEVRKDLFERNFDVEKGPLICIVATKIDKKRTIVHICHDGLVADGESHKIMLRQLEKIYYEGRIDKHCSFQEYSQYIKKLKERDEYANLLDEKVQNLTHFDTKPRLNTLSNIINIINPNVRVVSRIIPKNQYQKICEVARKNGVTPFSVFLTIFGKTLAKYSDNSRFLLNLPISYRPVELEGIENLIGLCSNFILFDFDDSCPTGFIEKIKEVQDKLFSHREDGMLLSGIDVLKKVKQLKEEEVIAPVVFTSTVGGKNDEEIHFKKNMTLSYTSQIWIEGLLTETQEGILFTLSYISELFDETLVNGIADVFIDTLSLFENEDERLLIECDMPLTTNDLKIIHRLNNTESMNEFVSFRDCIEKNSVLYADKYVFVDEQSCMTYRDLKEFCNKLNFILNKRYSLQPDDKVGLYLPKGVLQAACEVALAYLNIVFLPIDFEFPVKAIEECVSKVSLKLILTDTNGNMMNISGVQTNVINLEAEMATAENEKVVVTRNSEAMLINTSGSTGTPKTVILTWKGIINCINATQKLFGITASDIAFSVTNYSHDMSIFDVLGMAYIGGTAILPCQYNYKNPEIWVDMMGKYKVTVWVSVPALLEMLLYSATSRLPDVVGRLNVVVQGGDYLHVDTVKQFRELNQNGRLFNVGGPSETTMWNIYHEVTEDDIKNNVIPYGKPFPNTQYYILDNNFKLCPVEKEGLMYISGDGVTPGYVGREDPEKFVEYSGRRVYCSGDYGIYHHSGEILFRGRKDRQIKINGKRIELDGIEKKLNMVEHVKRGAVISKDKRIIAFYVAEGDCEAKYIKERLSMVLPEYMVPVGVYELSELPHNRNNKVDYKALAEIVIETRDQKSAETELEGHIAEICRNIFGIDKIDMEESFYSLGGDSVTAMRVAAMIKKELGVHMTPYDIFEHPTIRELAAYTAEMREL